MELFLSTCNIIYSVTEFKDGFLQISRSPSVVQCFFKLVYGVSSQLSDDGVFLYDAVEYIPAARSRLKPLVDVPLGKWRNRLSRPLLCSQQL